MDQKTLVTILVIVLILVGGAWVFSRSGKQSGDASQDATAKMAPLSDGSYDLNTTESTLTWTGKKVLVEASHTGTLAFSSGSVLVENGALAGGKFTVPLSSLTDDGSGVGKHLLSADFFDAEKFPEATVTIKKVIDGVVTADLTIKGITKEVTFPASISQDGDTLTATAAFAIDRSEWDIKFGSSKFFQDLGDAVIDDMVQISLSLVAVKKSS